MEKVKVKLTSAMAPEVNDFAGFKIENGMLIIDTGSESVPYELASVETAETYKAE